MHVLSSIFEAALCPEAASVRFGYLARPAQQLLHLVLGGELADLEHNTFKDLSQVEIVGLFPNYATAHTAWRAKAQQTVDNAQMRYFIVHLHRLLDPDQDAKPAR
jgi:hypothetical protein